MKSMVMTIVVMMVTSGTFVFAQDVYYPQVSELAPSAPVIYQSSSPTFSTGYSVESAPISYPAYVSPDTTHYTAGQYQTGQGVGGSGLAQQKAQQAAQMSLRGHLGGSLGSARYEGVGWSNISPQSAIENCCYWGSRPVSQIGVSKGSDGCWYACVLYQ